MSARYDCTDPAERETAAGEAVAALRRGELVVLPTDTVYGVAADAFSPAAVAALAAARGTDRQSPPAVLVGRVRAALALIEESSLSSQGKELLEEFWPGALTVVARASRSLTWDLGDTRGTVAVRMPLHQLALDVLKQVGPLAITSASRTTSPPPATVAEAEEQLGEAVAVYLDDGPLAASAALSTIIDLTSPVPRLLRRGAVSAERLREVAPLLMDDMAQP